MNLPQYGGRPNNMKAHPAGLPGVEPWAARGAVDELRDVGCNVSMADSIALPIEG